jgi:hypothetical protein
MVPWAGAMPRADQLKPSRTETMSPFRAAQYFAVLALAIALCCAVRGATVAGADEVNKSNNPLNPAPSLSVQDTYVDDYYDADFTSNDFLLRFATLLPPTGFLKVPQLIRTTVPISTRPDDGGGYGTALGDISVFDILVLKTKGTQLGVGPLLTLPTATMRETGTGKWQGGLAAIMAHVETKMVMFGLVQWQASFAGDDDRSHVNTLTVQPGLIFNLPNAWYLRSTGIWSFDLNEHHYYVPFGVGAGRVLKHNGTLYNLFLEPQWTVAHDGVYPKFGVFAGVNITFGK